MQISGSQGVKIVVLPAGLAALAAWEEASESDPLDE